MASRYKNIPILRDETGTRYYQNVIYPRIPETEDDIYLITTVGDRYDILAQTYYQDSSLWWVIASANDYTSATLIPTPGTQIRIPADKYKAVELFEQINNR
jgi:hypothetical protein